MESRCPPTARQPASARDGTLVALDLRDHGDHWPTDALAWSDARTTGDRPRQGPKVRPSPGPSPLRDQLRIEATVRGNSVPIFRLLSPMADQPDRMVQGAR